MAPTNQTLALALLVDATVQGARELGQGARDQRTEEAQLAVQRAADARRREIREAFANAGGRAVLLGPVWLFLCFLILANNFMENPFAEGSYAVTTWTFILVVAAGLVIDLAIGPGSQRWFVAGAILGFALSAWYTISRESVSGHESGYEVDVSMFWLTGFFGVAGYLFSAVRAWQSRQ